MVETVSVDDVEGSEPKPGITASQLVAGERMNAQHVRFDPGVVDDDPTATRTNRSRTSNGER